VKYMLLIYAEEGGFEQLSPEEKDASMGAWFSYTEEMRKAGAMVAGDALQSTASSTSVRVRDGKTLTTDGPFAETKEALGGFYILDVDSLDDALAWAGKCPGALYGTIEVRPVMVFDMAEAAG
jgi:hypothetical protein